VQEQRESPRKVLRTRVGLAIDGREPVFGKTVDVSVTGCCVCVADPVAVAQSGQVAFDLMVEGHFSHINTRVKAMYCIFGGGDYKIGLKFVELDMPTAAALARYMKSGSGAIAAA